MLQFVSLKEYKHPYRLLSIWNKDVDNYRIALHAFKSRILEDANLNKNASFVALYENTPVGFIIIKSWLEDSGIFNGSDRSKISLIFVQKDMRGMHIGTDLLNLSLNELKNYETIKSISLGSDIDGLFEGLPQSLPDSYYFFVNKGFKETKTVYDVRSVMRDNMVGKYECRYNFLVADDLEDVDKIIQFCISKNQNQEAYAIHKYYQKGGSGRRIVIAYENDKIVGVAKLHHTDRLFKKVRHVGRISFVIAENDEVYNDLLFACFRQFNLRKAKTIYIDNVDNLEYYKSINFSVYNIYKKFDKEI